MLGLGLSAAFSIASFANHCAAYFFQACLRPLHAMYWHPEWGYNGGYVAGLVTLSTLLGVLSLPFALGVLGGLKF